MSIVNDGAFELGAPERAKSYSSTLKSDCPVLVLYVPPMSDPVAFSLELPQGHDPLVHVRRLLELAGSAPDVVDVTIKTRAADRVAVWRRILSDSSVDDDGIYVR